MYTITSGEICRVRKSVVKLEKKKLKQFSTDFQNLPGSYFKAVPK